MLRQSQAYMLVGFNGSPIVFCFQTMNAVYRGGWICLEFCRMEGTLLEGRVNPNPPHRFCTMKRCCQ